MRICASFEPRHGLVAPGENERFMSVGFYAWIWVGFAGGVFLGRPSFLPCALARASPSIVRSLFLSRSKLAMAASMLANIRPAAVLRSMPSLRLMMLMPVALNSSSSRTSSLMVLPQRSRATNTTPSIRCRRILRRTSSFCGRVSLLLISSMYVPSMVWPHAAA